MTYSSGITGAIRCGYCGRPIASHGHMDKLTWVNGEPFHYQCTLPPSVDSTSDRRYSPYDLGSLGLSQNISKTQP